MNKVHEGSAQLDPGVILAEENSRYGLKALRIESLMQSILEQGGVMQPIEVEPLAEPVDGKLYRLTAGFYRHAAVSKLNADQGAGLTIPASVRPLGDSVQRLKRQLAENMERENQSPMDKAVAIKKLEEAGVPRMEIRKMFSTPGGRKGLQLQPASNSFINMTLSFLDLPKAIQEKIHDGRVGVSAAYELTKVPADKRAVILEKAEADRIKAIDADEKEEEKFLKEQKKLSESSEKETKTKEELQATEEALKAAKEAALAKVKASAEAYQAAKLAKEEDKAKAQEHFKATEADAKAAEKAIVQLQSKYDKLSGQSQKIKELAEAAKKKVADARKTANSKKKPAAVSAQDVKKAAQSEGVGDHVALNAGQMRDVIKQFTAQGVFPKVREIFLAIRECYDGVTTPTQMYGKVSIITGEKKEVAKKGAKA